MKNSTFTIQDFNSPDGMMTSIWGPPLWHFLHTISFNYPCTPTKKDKQHYKQFIESIADILPCKYCRENLPKNFKQSKYSPKIYNNRESFSRWMYTLHETVNKMLGKKSGLTYNSVKKRYEQFRSRCINDRTDNTIIQTQYEKGCVTPFYGKKTRCVLEIVPKKSKKKTFSIDSSCTIKRTSKKKISRKKKKSGRKKI
jgi:hypothetical protein